MQAPRSATYMRDMRLRLNIGVLLALSSKLITQGRHTLRRGDSITVLCPCPQTQDRARRGKSKTLGHHTIGEILCLRWREAALIMNVGLCPQNIEGPQLRAWMGSRILWANKIRVCADTASTEHPRAEGAILVQFVILMWAPSRCVRAQPTSLRHLWVVQLGRCGAPSGHIQGVQFVPCRLGALSRVARLKELKRLGSGAEKRTEHAS